MTIKKGKTYNKVTKAVITRHVENLKKLDEAGKIVLCGPFKGYPGVAGMVISKRKALRRPMPCAGRSRWLWKVMRRICLPRCR